MEKGLKSRMALLISLLIAGLILAGIGSALGAGTMLQGMPGVFGAMVEGNHVTIYEDGREIQNFTLPEGEEYTWNSSGGAIHIGRMTKEQQSKKQAEYETELNKLLQIAKNNNTVQKLLAGKNYTPVAVAQEGQGSMEENAVTSAVISILTFEVEGKYYEVTIDMSSKTVTSVREQSSGKIGGSYRKGVQ